MLARETAGIGGERRWSRYSSCVPKRDLKIKDIGRDRGSERGHDGLLVGVHKINLPKRKGLINCADSLTYVYFGIDFVWGRS